MPLNVLLIEDNHPDVVLVRRALRDQGLDFMIHEMNDAEEALAYIDRMGETEEVPCPDVVLLDLNVPKAQGTELLDAVRKSPKCPEVPVILISSSASPQDRAKAEQGGITRYFHKPIALEEFLKLGALVADVLKAQNVRRDRTAT